jgi:hypothetical protein
MMQKNLAPFWATSFAKMKGKRIRDIAIEILPYDGSDPFFVKCIAELPQEQVKQAAELIHKRKYRPFDAFYEAKRMKHEAQ